MVKTFCVAGSINMDLVTRSPRFPVSGETITGISFGFMPGGKGANQAVALARLGARVEMIGAIGDDMLGIRYGEVLSGSGVSQSGISVMPGATTGTASITVTDSGDNEIIVVPGANAFVSADYIKQKRTFIEQSQVLLLQLEIPLESVLEAATIAHRAGTLVILDPAPAVPLPDALLSLIDVITPNETEACLLTGENSRDEAGVRKAGAALRARGIPTVIVKAGASGAYAFEGNSCVHVPGFAVRTVDTVAAGDSFNAGFAFARARGDDTVSAIRFANAVAAISTTREGAQTAMPTLREVEEFM
jgi:ribokinase